MPVHTSGNLSSVNGSGGFTAIVPLPDPFFAAQNNSFLPPRDLKLLAAILAGSGLLRGRLEAPSLLRTAYPAVNPIQGSLTTASDMPRVCDYTQRPISLIAGEPIQMTVQNGGAASTLGLLVAGFDVMPLPGGEAFLIRYSITGGAMATANTWSSYLVTDAAPLVWETSLPSGTYAIVGMDHWGATAMAARLILPGYRYRPGVAARTSVTAAMNDPIFMDGRLGVLGYFTNWQMPGVEILCTAADTAFEGVIKVIRIGGPEMLPSGRGL